MENLPWAFISLMLPFVGLGKSIGHVLNHFSYGKDELGKAMARGAVMIAMRWKDWEPSTERELVYVHLPYFYTSMERLGLGHFSIIPFSYLKLFF